MQNMQHFYPPNLSCVWIYVFYTPFMLLAAVQQLPAILILPVVPKMLIVGVWLGPQCVVGV